ncbi:unnamed protein product [Vicia faba]|uniref:Uncharacterized protein n=1 Tax=Vicia faba TaxID=3906 RepID=A0AAV0ZYN9_VICFA|nr:unnamed protein product [Vicia faba]
MINKLPLQSIQTGRQRRILRHRPLKPKSPHVYLPSHQPPMAAIETLFKLEAEYNAGNNSFKDFSFNHLASQNGVGKLLPTLKLQFETMGSLKEFFPIEMMSLHQQE